LSKVTENKFKQLDEKFNIWEGVYDSFENASKDQIGPGFSGEEYKRRSLRVAKECLGALELKLPIPSFHKQRSNLLPITCSMMLSKMKLGEKLKVLDYGGGFGIGYMVLKESMENYINSVEYNIVEVSEVCKQGVKLFNSNEVFYNETLIPGESFDIIHASSVLQYIDDWKGLLLKFSSFEPKYILLSDIFAGEINPFVTLQNYYDSRIPHWFLNFNDIINYFSSIGYELIMKSYVSSKRLKSEDILPMDNFHIDNRLNMSLHLLLKKT